jgi:Holliday junction resolvase RusA-like endonuclease
MMVRLTFPWSVLVPDNRRHGLMRGRILLTAVYRDALDAMRLMAKAQHRRPCLTGRLMLEATFYEPDRRRRDVSNYAKLLGDALTGSVIADDSLLDCCIYRRGPIDRERPRAEVTVRVADEVAA